MTWITNELSRAIRGFKRRHYDRLVACGVTPEAMEASALENKAALGAMRVDFAGDHWEPSETGPEALITGVRAYGLWIDGIAWHPNEPTRWRFLTGQAVILGDRHLYNAIYPVMGEADPLIVHKTPLDLIKAGGIGCVVLDWQSAPSAIVGARRAIATDPEIKHRLNKILNQPPPYCEIRLAGREVFQHAA